VTTCKQWTGLERIRLVPRNASTALAGDDRGGDSGAHDPDTPTAASGYLDRAKEFIPTVRFVAYRIYGGSSRRTSRRALEARLPRVT
jgi:hypothetical protein